jgi:hypothetical protein
MTTDNTTPEELNLFSGILRMNAKVIGLVLGLIFGAAIFIMTNWIVLRGGHVDQYGNYVIGPHLQLLGQFFIGYSVTFIGSIVGFVYGFAIGTFSGALIGWIYNKIVTFRN